MRFSMKKFVLPLLVVALSAHQATAQSGEEAAVMEVVNRLFEGMRQADTAMVRSVFDSEAQLHSVGRDPRTGQLGLHEAPIDDFVASLTRFQPGQVNEITWDEVVQIDGELATVWAKYELVFNGQFSHCGIDAFDLWKSSDGWRIFQLTDTRRQENCWHAPM
jgi:hypothetical protein